MTVWMCGQGQLIGLRLCEYGGQVLLKMAGQICLASSDVDWRDLGPRKCPYLGATLGMLAICFCLNRLGVLQDNKYSSRKEDLSFVLALISGFWQFLEY